MEETNVKQRLEEYRISKRLSQDNIAITAKINPSTYKKTNNPTSEFLVKIAQAFPELSMDWLIRGEGEMIRKQKDACMASESPVLYGTPKKLTDDNINSAMEQMMAMIQRQQDMIEKLTFGK